MQRILNETKYVLAVLHRMRKEITANPLSFDPDALQRIDEAIAHSQHVLEAAQAWLIEHDELLTTV